MNDSKSTHKQFEGRGDMWRNVEYVFTITSFYSLISFIIPWNLLQLFYHLYIFLICWFNILGCFSSTFICCFKGKKTQNKFYFCNQKNKALQQTPF